MSPALPVWRRLMPVEHGIWGFVAAAALTGLPLGRTLAGAGLLLAVIALIGLRQARQPGDRLGCVLAAIVGIAIPISWGHPGWIAWAGAAALLAGAGILLERRPGPRPWWVAAITGLAFAVLAGAIAIAGGASVAATATASAGLAVLLVGTAPRVRALIRGGTWVHFALEWHLAITVLLTGGWAAGWVPGMVLAVSLLGLVQTGVVLHKDASAWHPRRIGSVELASTALVCLLLACSVRMA